MQYLLYIFLFLSLIPFILLQICFFLQIKEMKENDEDIVLKDILIIIFSYLFLIIVSIMPFINISFINLLYKSSSSNICHILINKILNYKIIKKIKNNFNNINDTEDVKDYYKAIKKSKKLVSKYQKKFK